MKKKKFYAHIKHYYLRGKTAKEPKEKLDTYYSTSTPSNTTVKRRMQEFEFGRTCKNDEPRSGNNSDATTPKTFKEILHLVTDDRKLKVRKIYKMVNI